MKIGVLTGGGDAPGLNAAIRAIVKKCEKYGFNVLGIKYGWAGLLQNNVVELKYEKIKNIITKSGTILKTSRTNPIKKENGIEIAKKNFKKMGLDALIAIGGDDTLSVAKTLSDAGLKIVGIPKTIDFDVPKTELTIGFDTSINNAMILIENIRNTSESHDRIFVIELMGRHAGWIALYSGLAAGADLILIPEEPFNIKEVAKFVEKKMGEGQKSIIIVVAEGALIKDYTGPLTKHIQPDPFGHVSLGGIGSFLAEKISKMLGVETRSVVPAHIIRGGSPTAYDRIVASRYGLMAVDLIKEGKFGMMVSLKGGEIVSVPLAKISGITKTIPKNFYEETKILFE
jgi:6-phosphofructokinase 1